MRRLALFGLAVLTLVGRTASAGVEDTLGLGARPMALGGSYAARPGDFAASYYNPAGLAPGGTLGDAERGGFFEIGLGFIYSHSQLHVTGAQGQSLAAPDSPDTAGIVLGTRFSLGRLFHIDGLDAGLSVFAPSHLFQWSIRPDDDIQWALLTDRTQVLSAHGGVSYRIARWLSIGVGLRVSFGVQTLTRGQVTSVSLDASNKIVTHTQLGADAQVFGQASPSAGILLTPIDRLRIGLVYRNKSYVDDWGNTRVSGIPDFGDLGYNHHFSHYFEPSEVTAAVALDITRNLDVSADLTFNRWSEALSTNLNTFGSTLWGDTWTPAFGLRYRPFTSLALMAGYRFQKSPLDNAGGPSNLLDADRHIPSLGFELELGKLFHAPSLDARFTVALSYIALVSRSETKDFRLFTSDDTLLQNPGYPSYSYGGHVLAGGAGIEGRW